MTLGVIKPEPQPIQPTFQSQPNQQVSGTQFNQFFNPTNFGGTFRTNTLTSGNAELDAIFEAAGRRYNLSPDLLKAVAKVESNFRPDATSRAGAMGIMQLMPGTARYLGVDDPFDPQQSIFGGARYLREQLDRFNGDIELALAAYNAGWPTVKQHGGIPPFRETQAYVQKVLGHLTDSDIAPSLLALTFDNSRAGHNTNNSGNANSSSGHHGHPGSSGSSGSSTPGAATPPENNNSAPPQITFNFDEALAQMLFNKLMNMKADAANSDSDSEEDSSGTNYETDYEVSYEENQEENHYNHV